jgi:hypothetical protein
VGNSIATIQEDTSSATWRHVPSQFNAVDLIYLTVSIFVGAATRQFSNIFSTRYVPFIFMPESSGVGRFHSVPGEHSQWPPTANMDFEKLY